MVEQIDRNWHHHHHIVRRFRQFWHHRSTCRQSWCEGLLKKREYIIYMLVRLYQIHSLLCPVLALLLKIHVMHLSVQHFGNTTAVYLHWRWIGIWMWREIGNGYIGNGSIFIQTRNNVKNAGNLERVHISRFFFSSTTESFIEAIRACNHKILFNVFFLYVELFACACALYSISLGMSF